MSTACFFAARSDRPITSNHLPQVATEHILLGLIAEDTSKIGYLNSGASLELVRESVRALNGRRAPIQSNETIVFSRAVRRTFEAATNVRLGAWGGQISAMHAAFRSTLAHDTPEPRSLG